MLLNCGIGECLVLLESPLGCKEIQPVHPKENQSWIFIGRTDIKAETSILWPHDVKSWLIGKDSDAGKDWRRKKSRLHRMRCWMASATQWTWVWVNSGSRWWTGRPDVLQSISGKDSDMTERLNWTEVYTSGSISPSTFFFFNIVFGILHLSPHYM